MKSCASKNDNWIKLDIIYNFRKVKKFHSRISIEDLAQVLRLSTVVDVGMIDRFKDGRNIEHFIRKKDLKVKSEFVDFFGYNVEKIK